MSDLNTRDVLDRTEMINPQTFADLKRLRMEYVQASRKNGADVGMKRLLTDLYPGRAHFIYELIQNADDAGATEVGFELKADRLCFSHNGKHLFSLDDIKSITNIGQSTKKADGTSIGKFGVGFKAVYSYTSRPVINSGSFHFQIYEMMVPEEINVTHPFYSFSKQTVFILPFDLKDKPAEKSCREIQEVLENFSEETILFLQNIKDVTFEISGNLFDISKKEKEHLVELRLDCETKTTSKYYLKFSKIAQIETIEGKKNLPIDIAYRLEKKEQKSLLKLFNRVQSLSDKYQIIPVNPDKSVYVSFIAEKEHSGLRFCINSFFSTTPSRDSIRDTDENRTLLSELVCLQEESLAFIKNNGLLNVDFLNVLPNSKDDLSDFYKPFYDNVVRLFREEPYMISKEDSYIPSSRLVSGFPSAITDIFTIQDLKKLADDYSYLTAEGWARNSPQKSSRSDIFISDLEIKKWSIDNFISFLSCVDENKKIRIIDVLNRKSSQQIINLYCLMAESKSSLVHLSINNAPIFKTVNGNFASIKDRVYLLREDEEHTSSHCEHNFILPELYTGPGKKKEQALKFLEDLDIGYFSMDAMCLEILDKYQGETSVVSPDEHINDIETLIKFGKFSSEEINSKKILQSNTGVYSCPNEVFLGVPYAQNNELYKLSNVLRISPISSIYKNRLKPSSLETFLKTVKNSNIVKGLTIERVRASKNPLYWEKLWSNGRSSLYGTDEDFTIKGLDLILASSFLTKAASELIWNFLLDVSEEYLHASYSPNRSCSTKRCDSFFVQLLAEHKWLLHSDGNLYSPEETSIENLPRTWRRPNNSDPYSILSLKAIGFGRKLESILQESREVESACNKLGMPKAFVECYRNLVNQGYSNEEIVSSLRSLPSRTGPMPVDNSVNPARRNEVAKQEVMSAECQVSAIKVRTVRVTGDKKKAKEYLKGMYTDDEGVLRCQMCHNRMPFKKKNGDFYFEATQISQNMKKELPAQYLCLCPNCAAEYSEWIINSDDGKRFIQVMLNRDTNLVEGKIYVSTRLGNGKVLFLYFTQKHFIDIKAILTEEYRETLN